MTKHDKLRDEKNTLLTNAEKVNELAKSEKRELTDDESKTIDDALARVKEIKSEMERIVADEARDAMLNSELAGLNKSAGRVAGPDPQTVTSTNALHTIEVGEPGYVPDPSHGFASPKDFIYEVMNSCKALARGNRTAALADPRMAHLFVPEETAGSDEQGAYADPYGGFLVPSAFSPNVMSLQAEADPTAGRTTNIPMTATTVKIPARVDKVHSSSVSGGLRVYRRAETDTSAVSRIVFEQVVMSVSSLFGAAYATEEILQDSPISFAAIIAAGFKDEFNSVILNEKLNGVGAGELEGINNTGALISVTIETGQAADTIVYENIIKMRARCYGYNKAIWLANHDCIPQLMLMNQSVGAAGIPIWQPSAREDHPDTILGRPAFFTEYTNTVGDAGDIVLGDWSQYLEGTYQSLQNAESIHVRFLNHERAFKFWMRNTGRSWWRTALTPKNGATLSPFVRLAVRE